MYIFSLIKALGSTNTLFHGFQGIPKPAQEKVADPGSISSFLNNHDPDCFYGKSCDNDIDEARRLLMFDSTASPIPSNPSSFIE